MPKDEKVYLSMGVLALAIILTVISVVALTIVAELNPDIKSTLTQLTGHHWITKGLAAMIVFVMVGGIGALIRREESPDPVLWAWLASGAALVGTIVLFLFFVGHFVATK